MKKFFYLSATKLVMVFFAFWSLSLTNELKAQFFEPSAYPDYEFPYAFGTSLNHPYSNVNTYSYYWDPTTVYDVMTWDDADNYIPLNPVPNAGLVFTARNPAALPVVINFDELSFPNVISLEAVILQAEPVSGVGLPLVPYVVASYYNTATQSFEVDIYEWNGTNLIQVPGFPKFLSPSAPGGYMDFDYIRIDALEKGQYGIVFCSNSEMYATSGFVGIPFGLNNTLKFDWHPDFPNGYTQPDIALCNTIYDTSIPGSGVPEAIIVALDAQKNQVSAFAFPFWDIASATLPVTNYSIPGATYTERGVDRFSKLELPRIDAFDISPSARGNVWSYVYLDKTSDAELIRAFIVDPVFMAPKITRSLNNMMDLFPTGYNLENISETINSITGNVQKNRKPVVAIEKLHYSGSDITDIGIFYGWYHQSGEFLPNATNMAAVNNDGYIGLKMNTFFEPLDFPLNNSYYVIPDPGTTMLNEEFPMPALAFSTNNDPNLNNTLIAFSKQDNAIGMDNVGYKFQDWNFLSFRPTYIAEAMDHLVLTVYPNPFTQSFNIKVENANSNEYSLQVVDILGRVVLQGKGSIADLNNLLNTHTATWASRQYILELTEKNTGHKGVLQLVKQQ